MLCAGQRRLRQMRADPAWQEARAIPRTHTQERRAAFSALRERYGFSEYAFHELARELRVSWLAEHLDAVLAQTLATRAYRALNRVCVGKGRRVRAQRVVAAGFLASRTSATIRACASCCRRTKKAIVAC